MRRIALLALPLALAGCQSWGPTWSEVTGDRYFRTEVNTSPTIINTIDGTSPLLTGNPTRIEPGRRTLALTAVPLSQGWKGGTDLAYFDLVAEPCKRYYVAARFENPLGPRFTPYLDYVEPIAGCTVTTVK
jgi:hypothetical protein